MFMEKQDDFSNIFLILTIYKVVFVILIANYIENMLNFDLFLPIYEPVF